MSLIYERIIGILLPYIIVVCCLYVFCLDFLLAVQLIGFKFCTDLNCSL